MPEEFRRDVFISYSRGDQAFAERLAADLVALDLRVWWDRWELRVGDSLIAKIQEGIHTSSWLAALLSPNSIESNWVKRELAAALIEEITADRVRVLPLLISDCELPPLLADKFYADFRTSYEAGFDALVARVDPPVRPEILSRILSDDESKVLSAWARLSLEGRLRYRGHLLRSLESPASADRMAALTALAVTRESTLPSCLLKLQHDPSSAIRQRVAHQVGRLRLKALTPVIENLLQDANPNVRSAARQAYLTITGIRA